jgi:polar amino acid transport system substrate-binding protein
MRKPWNSVACAAFLAGALTGMGGAARSAEPAQAYFFNPRTATVADGAPLQRLRFVTADEFAPFSDFSEQGTLEGVHVDLARAICARLGATVECSIQAVPFDEIDDALAIGNADAALGGIVPSAANRQALVFSLPYARLPARIATRAGEEFTATGRLAVIRNSVFEQMAGLMFPRATITVVDGVADLPKALASFGADAFLGDGVAMGFIALSPEFIACCKLQDDSYFLPALKPDALRIAVPALRRDLMPLMNAAILDLAASGVLSEVLFRHIPVALASTPAVR